MPIFDNMASSTRAMLSSLEADPLVLSPEPIPLGIASASNPLHDEDSIDLLANKQNTIRGILHFLLSSAIEKRFLKVQSKFKVSNPIETLTINERSYQSFVNSMSATLIEEIHQCVAGKNEDRAINLACAFLERHPSLLFKIINHVFGYLDIRPSYLKTDLARQHTLTMIASFQKRIDMAVTSIVKSRLDGKKELVVLHLHGLFDDYLRTAYSLLPEQTKEQKKQYRQKNQEVMSSCYMTLLQHFPEHAINHLYQVMLNNLHNTGRFVTILLSKSTLRQLEQMIRKFFADLAPDAPKEAIIFAQMMIISEIKKVSHTSSLDTIEESDFEMEYSNGSPYSM